MRDGRDVGDSEALRRRNAELEARLSALETARAALEARLAAESGFLQALMDNLPDAIFFKDREGRFLRVGRNFRYGGLANPEDALGRADFDFFPEERALDSYEDDQEILRTGIPLIDKVELETFPDRPDAWVSTTKMPLFAKDGEAMGIVGIVRDVTDRMAAQESIRRAKDDLEIRVRERTEQLRDANQRLESRVFQLDFLNSAAQRLAHFTHRRELLPAIVELFGGCFPGLEVGLFEPESGGGYRLASATSRLAGDGVCQACEKALATVGALSGSPRIVPDWRADATLASSPLPGLEDLPVYALFPLEVEGRILALVQLSAAPAFLPWYRQESLVLLTLAAQAAVSLSNANNLREVARKTRLQSELEVARSIQKRFTPHVNPCIPGIRLKGLYFPANEVGGDYLDYFRTDSGQWVIVIADVSGKGVPAALIMTMLRSAFRAEARYRSSAKELMCAINEQILSDLDEKSFVTALCLILDPDCKTMRFARAGHPPMLLQRGAEGPRALNSRGLALGMVAGTEFNGQLEEVTLPLHPGDRVLMFTDGLLEAMDPERRIYGMDRLLGMLSTQGEREPEAVLLHILEDLRRFTRDEPHHDDLTLLSMEVVE